MASRLELAVEAVALFAGLAGGDGHGDDDVAEVELAVGPFSPSGKLRTSVGLSFFMNFRLSVRMACVPTKARLTSGSREPVARDELLQEALKRPGPDRVFSLAVE